MMAPISAEEQNFVRLMLLLNGVTPRAVRTLFDKIFPHTNLNATLQANRHILESRKNLNQAQLDLLFPKPNGVAYSMAFDVTLMVYLIRNFSNINRPTNGFDSLPLPKDTSPESDLARIKWYRNKLSHHDSDKIDSVFFTEAWDDLSYAVGRLGGQQMKEECQELKSKILDPSHQEIMRGIRQSQLAIDNLESRQEEITETIGKLRDSHDTLKQRTNDNFAGLQNLPPNHNDSAKRIFESADPNVPSTSQPLPSRWDVEKNSKSKKNVKKNSKSKKDVEKTKKAKKDVEKSKSEKDVEKNKSEKDLKKDSKSNKNFLLRILTLIIVLGCIAGVVALSIQYKYFLGLKDTPTPKKGELLNFPDKCKSNVSNATVGEPICVTHTQEFTSNPSRIHAIQESSQHLGSHKSISVNVSSDPFVQEIEDVIIIYNSSRTNKEYGLALKKATCENIGKYNFTIEYSDGNVKSLELKFTLGEPTLKHSVNRINDSIHVYCEMKNNCKTISVNLFVNDGDSSRVIPTNNDCSNPDRKSSSKIIAEAIIPVSWFSGNQTISCVPFMTDLQLAANLTSTMSVPACEGDNCEPNCKDDPHSIAYFQDKHLCNIFYQCSNGDIFLQKCLNGTSWSHSKCTCVHFDNEICDTKTNKFFQPAMSFEKCAKS